jgi:hypothetical protein
MRRMRSFDAAINGGQQAAVVPGGGRTAVNDPHQLLGAALVQVRRQPGRRAVVFLKPRRQIRRVVQGAKFQRMQSVTRR